MDYNRAIALEHEVNKLEGQSTEYIEKWLAGLSKAERGFIENNMGYELAVYRVQAAWRDLWRSLIEPFKAIGKHWPK